MQRWQQPDGLHSATVLESIARSASVSAAAHACPAHVRLSTHPATACAPPAQARHVRTQKVLSQELSLRLLAQSALTGQAADNARPWCRCLSIEGASAALQAVTAAGAANGGEPDIAVRLAALQIAVAVRAELGETFLESGVARQQIEDVKAALESADELWDAKAALYAPPLVRLRRTRALTCWLCIC